MARLATVAEIEETPEADRLEGYPHPRHAARVYGFEALEKTVLEAFHSHRLPHGFLICGASGIGKAAFAYRMARFLLANPEDRDSSGQTLDVPATSPASRQLGALAHPGFFLLRRVFDPKAKRFKNDIAVDDVRRMRTFLSLTADEGQWRIVLIDTADDFNASAANAVLKSLEEPPVRTVFILLASAPGRVIATIRSRCRVLTAEPLNPADLKRAVTAAIAASTDQVSVSVPSGEDWLELESLAGGSVRQVLTLSGSGGVDLSKRVNKLLAALPQVDWVFVHTLSDEISSAAAEVKFELFQDVLAARLADLIRAEALGQGSEDNLALAHRLIGPARLAAFAQLWETIAGNRAAADALNLDRKTLILDTVARLEAACRT